MKEIKIICTNEQALAIYEKKCLSGETCSQGQDCDKCLYYTENVEFEISDRI